MPFLDTTALLDVTGKGGKSRQESAREVIARHQDDSGILATSRFNLAELLVGIELCTDPIVERRRVDDALEHVLIMEFDEASALRFAKIAARLRKVGKLPGTMDLLIASVASGLDQPFITRNPKHFSEITELNIVTY